VFWIVGLGLGALMFASGRSPRAQALTLRERAIEAQRIAELAARIARDLAARWSEEEERQRH